MIEISPFKALRPIPELVSAVNSPPYDVISQNEAAQIISKNPNSFLRVIKPEATIPSGKKVAYPQLAVSAARNLKNMIEQKIMITEQEPCFYIYQQKDDSYQRTGIVACLSAIDYKKGNIRKHEDIRIQPWEERVQHIKITRSHTGCPLIFYKANSYVEEIAKQAMVIKNAIYDFISDDGVRNCCWKISQENIITAIKNAFREIESVYIADGHHRVAAAVEVAQMKSQIVKQSNEKNRLNNECFYFPALIVPHNQIRILGYHRLVKNFPGFSPSHFLQELEKICKIEKIVSNQPFLPQKKHEIGMNLDGHWYKLLTKENHISLSEDMIDQLDVSILQNRVLEPFLEIKNPQKSKRIDFIGGKDSLSKLNQEIQNGARIAFTLYPTSVDEVIEISDQNEIMPSKSTWFEPKVRSGIFVHQF